MPAGNIDALEIKYFEHTYPTDALSRRLDRVEKFVFGGTSKGSDQQRLSHLLSTIPVGSPATAKSATTSNTRRSSNQGSSFHTDYPAVTTLETEILGTAHTEEPLKSRLERMERKAFGQSSIGSDLSVRVYELQRYAKDNGLTGSQRDHYPVAHYVPPPPPDAKLDAKVEWLEQQVYGRSVPDRSILERLRRLNATVLPHEPIALDESPAENVNTLTSAVQLDHASQLVEASDSDPATVQPPAYKPVPMMPGDFSAQARNSKLNSTAAKLQDAGMPSPMSEVGIKPEQLASSSTEDDDKNDKKKKHGFWSMVKESFKETYSDNNTIMGVPRYAYGDSE